MGLQKLQGSHMKRRALTVRSGTQLEECYEADRRECRYKGRNVEMLKEIETEVIE